MIVAHLIEREYASDVDPSLPFSAQLIELAKAFRTRLTALVAHWVRVGYCQGNFNSDNCAAGGYTLDYGPFGFCELFDPRFQPWIGGGEHFSFFNQPAAAEANFQSFCSALIPLLQDDPDARARLDEVQRGFAAQMRDQLDAMWVAKLGLSEHQPELIKDLLRLMVETQVDYTIFFRELSKIPRDVSALRRGFYRPPTEPLQGRWTSWLQRWHERLGGADRAEVSARMKAVNPKFSWREWLVVPAYQEAAKGDYRLVHELQDVLTRPYDEAEQGARDKYDQLRPEAFFNAGGVSHYSCSS